MKNIYGISFNPSIDIVFSFSEFQVGEVNFSDDTRIFPAGKLLNVIRALDCLDDALIAEVFIGAHDLAFFKAFKSQSEIAFHTQGNRTRRNITLINENRSSSTHIVSKAEADTSVDLHNPLVASWFTKWKRGALLILNGSLPANTSVLLYKNIILRANEQGIKTILDTRGMALKSAIASKPFSITPNLLELNELLSLKLKPSDRGDLALAIKQLWNLGVELPIITLGREGAVYGFRKTKKILQGKIEDNEFFNINATGCGDSLVAGLVRGLRERMNEEDLVTFTQKVAYANLYSNMPGDLKMNKVENKKVVVTEL